MLMSQLRVDLSDDVISTLLELISVGVLIVLGYILGHFIIKYW